MFGQSGRRSPVTLASLALALLFSAAAFSGTAALFAVAQAQSLAA